MREFKFRVWDKDTSDFIKFDNETFIVLENVGFRICSSNENVEVMQYTGLKDKTGREIYEGDIIPHHLDKSGIGIVRFDNCVFYVDWKYARHKELLRKNLDFWAPKCEVIGNIYADPELLEVKS